MDSLGETVVVIVRFGEDLIVRADRWSRRNREEHGREKDPRCFTECRHPRRIHFEPVRNSEQRGTIAAWGENKVEPSPLGKKARRQRSDIKWADETGSLPQSGLTEQSGNNLSPGDSGVGRWQLMKWSGWRRSDGAA